nr:E2 protein [Rodent papillomavirus]
MESLCSRLSAVQEELMCIYEEGDNSITTQVRHWQLIRHEQVLLHAARQQGHTRIGMQVVPSLAATQASAKAAIEMHLLLQSLAQSPFAKETWTLSETSRDMYLTEPSQTFKKSGQTIEVFFDGCKDNTMQYTKWRQVFYTDERGVWHRVPSVCDETGIFFDRNGNKEYYVRFQKEAAKYSVTGEWEAVDEGKIYASVVPITSSTPTRGLPGGSPLHPHGVPASGHTGENWDPVRDQLVLAGGGQGIGEKEGQSGQEYPDGTGNPQDTRKAGRDGGETEEGSKRGGVLGRGGVSRGNKSSKAAPRETCETDTVSKPLPKAKTATRETTSCGEARPQKRAIEHKGGGKRKRRRWETQYNERGSDFVDLDATGKVTGARETVVGCDPPTPNPPNITRISTPSGVQVARPSCIVGTPGAPPSLLAISGLGVTPKATAERNSSRTTESTRRTRSHRVSTGSPCLLIIKGTPNGVKCLRYRLKSHHSDLFTYVSTTWQWVPASSSNRIGRARILIMCQDDKQRNRFLSTVKIPAGMTVEQCSMVAI